MSVFFKRRGPAPVRYSIDYMLVGVSSSNQTSAVYANTTYSTTLTFGSEYTMMDVEVRMNGSDITDSVYDNGTVTIPNVTGNVLIAAVAKSVDYKTWYFNESVSTALDRTSINFVSNNRRCTSIRCSVSTTKTITVTYYTTTSISVYTSARGWTNESYRTVVFDAVPTGDLRTWLELNATAI